MVGSLPSALTNPDSQISGSPDPTTTLYKYLGIFGYQFDVLRSYVDQLKYSFYDSTSVPGPFLALMLRTVGQNYEPALGMNMQRRLGANILHVYKRKGTNPGISVFADALTKYAAKTTVVPNLMLDYNEGSFEESTGHWVPTPTTGNCTVGHVAADANHVTYVAAVYPTGFTNMQTGYMTMTATAAANMSAGTGNDAPVTDGIPVTAGTTYTASVYSRAQTTARQVAVDINWYNGAGTLLSTSSGTAVSNAVGALNTSTTWSTRVTNSAAAPANAVYAGLTVRVLSPAAGEVHDFDAVQFEAAAAASNYRDPREIVVTVTANRINEVTNPNFESAVGNWAATGATAATSATQFHDGAQSLALTTSVAGNVVLNSGTNTQGYPVFASTPYAASFWVRPGAARTVTAAINWYDNTNTLISTTTGTGVAAAATTWTRVWVTGSSPANVASATVTLTVAGTALSEVTYVDSVLLERGSVLQNYFDGSTGSVDPVSRPNDYLWEGTTNASRSHYYPNLAVRFTRLVQRLPEVIPHGATFVAQYAQPGT